MRFKRGPVLIATTTLIDRCEVHVAQGSVTLCCPGIGSSLALCLWDGGKSLFGLAHLVLPTSPQDSEISKPAMYVDSGLQALLEQLTAQGAAVEDIRAAYAGGASVITSGGQTLADIGARNIRAIEQGVAELGLYCVASESGGRFARSLTLDTEAGEITIQGTDEEGRVLCTLKS